MVHVHLYHEIETFETLLWILVVSTPCFQTWHLTNNFFFNPLRKSVGWATRWYFALFSKKLYARTLCHFVELSCFTHSHYGFFVPQSKDTHRSLTDNSKMHVGPGLHKAYRHIATWLLNENRRPLLLN